MPSKGNLSQGSLPSIEVAWILPGNTTKIGTLEVESAPNTVKEHYHFTPTREGVGLLVQLGLNHAGDNTEILAEHRTRLTDNDVVLRMIFDSAPDCWGRRILREKELLTALEEDRRPRRLGEVDYLPTTRQTTVKGALGLSYNDDELTLKEAFPSFDDLSYVEHLSHLTESRKLLSREEIGFLARTASTLGGAGPKLNCIAPDGSFWIAKLPSVFDDWDVEAWEMVCLELARHCGIMVPETKLAKTPEGKSALLVKRFDRNADAPIPFLSARVFATNSVCGSPFGNTNSHRDYRYSYMDIARFLRGQNVDKSELRELWTRMVFNMAVKNTDDHIKNHGYVYSYEDSRWHLSPLYDVNPNPYGEFLSLCVDDVDTSIDFSLALSVSDYFEICRSEATHAISNIRHVVASEWEPLARQFGINESEIELMQAAFA